MGKPITLITGARKGIGRFLAEHYLAKGHCVYGCSRQASEFVADDYHHVCLDVADEKSVRQMFSHIRKEHQRIDHVINNAGIASMNHAILTPSSTVSGILNTNVLGTFLVCREAAKLMQTRKVGRIVNFISVASPLQLEGEAVYAASKSAVETMTKILAREFSQLGITVNAIGPTPVKTDLIRGVPQVKIDELLQRQAINRLGTFDDIANVVDFFLSKRSEFVTGQSIFLGGVS